MRSVKAGRGIEHHTRLGDGTGLALAFAPAAAALGRACEPARASGCN